MKNDDIEYAKIQLRHRLPPADWTESPGSVCTELTSLVLPALAFSEQLLEEACNLPTRGDLGEHRAASITTKVKLIDDYLEDIRALLDHLEKAGANWTGAPLAAPTKTRSVEPTAKP